MGSYCQGGFSGCGPTQDRRVPGGRMLNGRSRFLGCAWRCGRLPSRDPGHDCTDAPIYSNKTERLQRRKRRTLSLHSFLERREWSSPLFRGRSSSRIAPPPRNTHGRGCRPAVGTVNMTFGTTHVPSPPIHWAGRTGPSHSRAHVIRAGALLRRKEHVYSTCRLTGQLQRLEARD